MPFVAIPEAWEVAFNGSFRDSSHKWALVWGVFDVTDHDVARAEEIGAEFESWWTTGLSAALCDQLQLDSIRVTDQESETGVSINWVGDLPVTGQSGGAPSAAQSAMIVTLQSSERGRSSRGRKYIVGLPATAHNAGDASMWDPDQPALYAGIVEDLVTALAGLGDPAALAVLSRSDAECKLVTSVIGRRYMGTQRRRVRE